MAVRPSTDEPFGPAINLPSRVNHSGPSSSPWVWTDGEGQCLLVDSDTTPHPRVFPIGFGSERPEAPRARFTLPAEVFADEDVAIDASASTPTGDIVSYGWTIGRETAPLRVRDADQGEVVTYRFVKGRHQVTLVVTADDGACDVFSRIVDVKQSRRFLRGDCNDDGKIDLADAVCVLNWLFAGEAAPGCVAATNTNGDDDANIADATYLLNHLFAGGPAPAQPFPDCGTGDLAGLGCETSCQ